MLDNKEDLIDEEDLKRLFNQPDVTIDLEEKVELW
jgi:hypothetical protein